VPLRHSKPLTFRPSGLSDSEDGSNAFPGSMRALVNLIPNPKTDKTFIPRPASVQLTSFAGFSTPGFVSSELVVGNIAYGTIASARNPGKDEPYAYNLLTNSFLPISGVTAANTPTSPPTLGDWVPPIVSVVGTKIVITHPGFPGAGTGKFFGWLDISAFSDATKTGNTHSSTLIDNLSVNVLQAGWTPGMTISGSGIPAGDTIVSIASNGLSLTLAAATTTTVAGVALTVAGGTASAPLWAAGNTNGNALASVPVAVAQFNGRAYFAVGDGEVFSDSGNALQVTNATQAIVHSNGLPVTALGALPLSSPVTGGIIQAIVAFQSNFAMQIITGDISIPAGTPGGLLTNVLRAGTGTLAPLSLFPFELGLGFISPEGARYIDFDARVSEPVGDHGKGVTIPFILAINPSRICAAANADTVRITVKNGNNPNLATQEYWYDLTRKVWTGPHSFPASLIQPWGSTFAMVATGINAALWQSDANPSLSSSYVENGAAMAWEYRPTLMPDNDDMSMNHVVESTLACKIPPQGLITVTALNEADGVLDAVTIKGSGSVPTQWGQFLWNKALWLGGTGVFQQVRLDWHQPLVFKQFSPDVTGNSLVGVVLGNIYLRYQKVGYLLPTVR